MRILITNYSSIFLPGGVNKTIREISKGLAERGHECIVLNVDTGTQIQKIYYYDNKVKIIQVKSYISKYLYGLSPSVYFFLKKNIYKLGPDIIHLHGFHTLFTPELAYLVKKRGLPMVFSPHYGIQSHNTWAGKYLWWLYKRTAGRYVFKISERIICASEFEANMVAKDFGVADKISIIPHGVDRIATKKSTSDKSNKKRLTLLYVGYLLKLKGVQHILRALHELVKYFDNRILLNIVGEGDYKDQLVTLANKLDVNDKIRWYSFLYGDELLKKYEDADIFLLLSQSENYGIVVAEALACGTPCIVANTTALKEFTKEPGCFGIDYPPDPKELAELIIKVYESDVRVGPFSRKIRTWDEVAKDYERVYRDVLEGKL